MFIVSVVSVVLICSLVQFYNRIVILPEWRIPQSELLKSLSVMESTRKVFYSREWSYETYVFHAAKWFVITSGTMAHIIGCVEMPISYYMMGEETKSNNFTVSDDCIFIQTDMRFLMIFSHHRRCNHYLMTQDLSA